MLIRLTVIGRYWAPWVMAALATVFSVVAISPGQASASPPTTSIVVPSDGATLSGVVPFDAVASSSVGVASVTYELTGGGLTNSVIATGIPSLIGWLALWNSTSVPNGTYLLTSVATDTANVSTTSAPVTVTVTNTPPATSVLVPSVGATVSGTAVLDAAASSGIRIAKVQFVLNGGTLSDAIVGTAIPTLFGWYSPMDTTAYPNGTYSLTSVATDTANVSTTSTPISVTISNAPVANPPPGPEPIALSELPVPPTAPSSTAGSCTATTGCVSGMSSGGFLPDNTIVAVFTYAGAPVAPDPRSIYSGTQLALMKTDGSTFPDGDPWLCLTCGIPAANEQGVSGGFSYPQPFSDGMRILAGSNVVDCTPYPLDSPQCTASSLHIYPVYWQNTSDGSGPGGTMSGLKLNPDQVHVGWNSILIGPAGYNEYAFMGHLTFDSSPTAGTPLVPRYEVANVSMLFNSSSTNTGNIQVDPSNPKQLDFNPLTVGSAVGEFKGFSGDGESAIGIGDIRSGDIDHFATNLSTGAPQRLDADPYYSDPDTSSPDNKWTLEMDVRYQNRFMFIAGMPGVPPVLDQAGATGFIAGYNIGSRRLFQPWLTETSHVGQGIYDGQQINACTTGPCSTLGIGSDSAANSPLWGSMADSAWSPDGTKIVYWQAYAAPGTCGPPYDAISCPQPSTEPGGRSTRIMLAVLTSRTPEHNPAVAPISDSVPWGTPFPPGSSVPNRPVIPTGSYTMHGKTFGSASVKVVANAANNAIVSMSVTYSNYSDDGLNIINGTESTSLTSSANPLAVSQTYHEALTLSGVNFGAKVTSEPGGYTLLPTDSVYTGNYQPTGTMTTTLDGVTYDQPPSYPSA